MKKMLLVLLMFFLLGNTISVRAEETEEPEMNGFGNPSAEVEEWNRAMSEAKRAHMIDGDELNDTRIYVTLNVPVYTQEQSYYCGPACVQMVLKYLTGVYYSQSTLASYMQTNTSGTYVYQIVNGLNHYLNVNGIASFYNYESTYNYSIDLAFKNSLDQGYPCIANVEISYLYPGSGYYGGHYIVINGYNYPSNFTQGNQSDIQVVTDNINYFTYRDPWNNSTYGGTHTVKSALMNTSINGANGYYIW